MDSSVHDTISVVAMPTAILAFLQEWNPFLTTTVALFGLAWYGVLFYDRFVRKRDSLDIDK